MYDAIRPFIERGGSVGNRGRPAMCIQVLGEEERKRRRRRKKEKYLEKNLGKKIFILRYKECNVE